MNEGWQQEQGIAAVLECIAFCGEFSDFPLRHNEENENAELCEAVKWGVKEDEVSERSERALRKTRILAMNPAKWLQTLYGYIHY